jgi:Pyridine nucleotide-disulphide oxidoreductase
VVLTALLCAACHVTALHPQLILQAAWIRPPASLYRSHVCHIPHRWSCAGVEHCINSDGILELKELPKRLGIIGGGYIGVEFGGMFNNLGAKVDFFIRGEKLLRGFDEAIRDKLHDEYGKQGITINTGCAPPAPTPPAPALLGMQQKLQCVRCTAKALPSHRTLPTCRHVI